MDQKRIGFCLTGAGIAAGIGGAFVVIMYVFSVLGNRDLFPAGVLALIFVGMGLLVFLYGLALLEYLKITVRIGKSRSFCRENGKGLGWIARYLWLAAGLWIASLGAALLPSVGAGIWMWGFLLFALASTAMGGLSWGLGKLVDRAVQLQEENDLTV